MNLKILSTKAMMVLSGFLLEDAAAQAVLSSRELGRALSNQLAQAHELLELVRRRRGEKDALVKSLTRLLTRLDALHDRRARAFFHLLHGCMEALDDADLADLCLMLIDMCFPDGLDVVNASYVDEGGWARWVGQQVSQDMVTRLEAVTVGQKNLGQVFREWIEAGVELGARTNERARAQADGAATGVNADTLNINTVRSQWIRTMQTLIGSADLMKLDAAERMILFAPIEREVAAAERGAASDADEPADGDAPTDAPADGDAEADADALLGPSLSGELILP